jgi:SecD/SecF fusion protein
MKGHSSRVVVILAVTALGLYFMLPPKDRLKLGIDLRGGTILVYEVDKENRPAGFQMEQMIATLSKRLNPAGTLDMTIRPMGGDRIEIIMPAADPQEVQAVQDKITQTGTLEFRILANDKHDRNAIRNAREKLKKKEAETAPSGYQWVRLDDPVGFNPFGSSEGESAAVEDGYVLTKLPKESERVTGDDLTRAEPTTDERMQLAVGFHFDANGTRRFRTLTRNHQPEQDGFHYRLAIVLDDRVMSAPVLKTAIEGGSGIIEGGRDGFKAQEVDNLVAVLNAGKLPAMLVKTPISVDKVTATLGEDTIRQGARAILVSMIIVPVFMLIYYLFCGLVADVALALNLIVILGFMGLSESTFTLSGLAGLALTIGMAVDANVLIFERIREERERGGSLSQSIRNGFDRAWLAIFDSNLTTIITALILWWLGTDQVKGFALTLMAGLVANLFTAVFVTRVIFEICLKKGWISELKMFHLIKTPSFDYVTPRHYFIIGSVIVIGIGLAATALRGGDILDIDFTGGTAISVRLTKETETKHGKQLADFVRETALEVLPNVKVERLISEQQIGDERGPMFLVRTTNPIQREVREKIIEKFRDMLGILETIQITKSEVEPIPEAQAESTEDKDKNAEKSDAKKEKKEPPHPFAGGQRLRLTLNQEVSRDAVAAKLNQSLAAKKFDQPELLYQLERVDADQATRLGRNFVLETKQDVKELLDDLRQRLERDPIFERENNFGPQVAGETRLKAIGAMVLSWVAMIVYLWLRFKDVSYGFAAVVALVHDVLVALTFVALGGWVATAVPGLASALLIDDFKIDLTVVSAFMTIIGYSVNDTIVIFDRIREIKGKSPAVTAHMINRSVNECMSRTILTSLTVIIVLAILFIWGGPGSHGFSFAMLIGCISGTYSTIFIAAPILILFAGRSPVSPAPRSVQYQSAAASA